MCFDMLPETKASVPISFAVLFYLTVFHSMDLLFKDCESNVFFLVFICVYYFMFICTFLVWTAYLLKSLYYVSPILTVSLVHVSLLSLSNFKFCVIFMMCFTWLSAASMPLLWILFFLFVCLFCRSLTSNLPNVNLPNVNLQIPKVPNLPVPVAGLSVNLPQMPSFSTPSWMAAIYDSECVFNKFTLEIFSQQRLPWYEDALSQSFFKNEM